MRFKSHNKTISQIITGFTVLSVILCSVSFYPRSQVQAFMPWQYQLLGLFTPLSRSHEAMTRITIERYDRDLFNTARLTPAMENAIKQIIERNAATDNLNAPTFGISANHVDGENFTEAHARLVRFKQTIKNFLDINQPAIARFFLGGALHTLQDFYSHSNWVELGQTNPHPTFGEIGSSISNTPVATKTCTDCERNECDQCYDPERTPPLTNLTTNVLTSGYYLSSNPRRPVEDKLKPHRFKCSHGGRVFSEFDKSGKGTKSNGINKDTKDCDVSPHHDRHVDAYRLAQTATTKYLDEIKAFVGVPKMKLLLGGSPALVFLIDTTGSMIQEIGSVRQQILQIIDRRVALNIPTRYILMPFNDPGVGPLTSTEDPNVFRNAVNALTASAGGDCPELLYTGLYRALEEVDESASVFVFTDADAKDQILRSAATGLAIRNNVSINHIFSGGSLGCGQFGFGYFELASETGGSFFSIGETETGTVTQLADFLALPRATHVFSATGNFSPGSQVFTIPIDSTLNSATFTVSGTGATNVVVRRPDGTTVSGSDPNVSYISTSNGVVASVASPVAGAWTVTLNGGIGKFSVKVSGESDLNFTSFDFTEFIGGRHGGHFPISGYPVAGEVRTAIANVAIADASSLQVQFRNMDGSTLQTVTLEEVVVPIDEGDPEQQTGSNKQYAGDVTVPSVPFQVYVTGQDGQGMTYTRLVPGIVKPQQVRIAETGFQDLYPGQTSTFTLQVKNSGPSDTFTLNGADGKGYIQTISPTSVTLGTGATRDIKVTVRPPANAVAGTQDTFTFTVASSTIPNVTNTAVVGPVVVQEAPALNLGAVTTTALGGNNDAFVDPGEGGTMNVQLINTGSSVATSITATLTTDTPGITVSVPNASYPNIAPANNAVNSTPFLFYAASDTPCGQTINFRLVVTSTVGATTNTVIYDLSHKVGQASFPTAVTASYTGPAVAIPDDDFAGVNIPIQVSGINGSINDLNFRIDGSSCSTTEGSNGVGIDHTWISDVVVKLISPSGTVVTLVNRIDNDANNLCSTTLDDEASTSIQTVSSANAPFSGTFKPAETLGHFDGENPNGTWMLNVSDRAEADVGNVRAFSLVISPLQSSCSVTPADTTPPSLTETAFNPGPPASVTVTAQDAQSGLAAINVVEADNVQVQVASFTPGTTSSVVVTGTLINPTINGSFDIEAFDVAGNMNSFSRTITGNAPRKILFRTDRHGAFVNYELYTMNDDGSNQTRVTNTPATSGNYQPTWSPNGLKIAYAAELNGFWDIFVANPDGTNPVNLTQHNAFESYYAWSPDSSKIVFESHRDGPFALWKINVDGTGLTKLINNGGPEQPPAWSPNGQKIAFLSFINSVNSKTDVWVMNQDGTNPINLTQSADQETHPRWSPDGTKIAFARRPTSSSPYDIYVMNADGSNVQRLTTNSTSSAFDWSPDSSKIVFQSNRDGNLEIYVMNADGSSQTRLTNSSGSDFSPKWTSDGSRMLFISFRTGNYEVFIMNANGTGQVNLTNNAALDDSASWQP